MTRTSILIALAVLLGASQADAACNLARFSVTSVSATYDPFMDTFAPADIGVAIQTDNSADCTGARVQFAITYLPSMPQPGSQLNLRNSGRSLTASLIGPGGQSHPISNPATAFANDPNSFPVNGGGVRSGGPVLQLSVPVGQPVPPGGYSAELILLARVTSGKNETADFSTPFSVNVVVKPSVRLAAGSGGLMIDVGELTPGAVGGPIRFDAYANVDYDLRLISDNNFALRRQGSRETVPYEPIISGADVGSGDQSPGSQGRDVSFGAADGGGLRHHTFGVRILPFSGARAGDYLDMLTVEIRARV